MRTQTLLAVLPLVAMVAAQGAPGGSPSGQQSTDASKKQESNRPYHIVYSAVQGTGPQGAIYESHISSGPVADDADKQGQQQQPAQQQQQQQQQQQSSQEQQQQAEQQEDSSASKHTASQHKAHASKHAHRTCASGAKHSADDSHASESDANQSATNKQAQESADDEQSQSQGQGQDQADASAQQSQQDKANADDGAWESNDSAAHRELHGNLKVNQTELHGQSNDGKGKTVQQDGKLTQGQLHVDASEDEASHSEKHAASAKQARNTTEEQRRPSAGASASFNGRKGTSSSGIASAQAGLDDNYNPSASANIKGNAQGRKGSAQASGKASGQVSDKADAGADADDCSEEPKTSHTKSASANQQQDSTADRAAASQEQQKSDKQQTASQSSPSKAKAAKGGNGDRGHVSDADLKPGEANYDADSSLVRTPNGISQGRVDDVAGVSKEGAKAQAATSNGVQEAGGNTVTSQGLDSTSQKAPGAASGQGQQGGGAGAGAGAGGSIGGPPQRRFIKRQTHFTYGNTDANSASGTKQGQKVGLHAKQDPAAAQAGAQGGAIGPSGAGAGAGAAAGGAGSAAGGAASAQGHQRRSFFGRGH